MGGVHVAPFPTAYRYGWSEEEATAFALKELDYILATLTSPQETAAFIVEPVLGEGGTSRATPPSSRVCASGPTSTASFW